MQGSSKTSKGNRGREKKKKGNIEMCKPRLCFGHCLDCPLRDLEPTPQAKKFPAEPKVLGYTGKKQFSQTWEINKYNQLIRNTISRQDSSGNKKLALCKQNSSSLNYHWLSVAHWIKKIQVTPGHPVLSSRLPASRAVLPKPLSSLQAFPQWIPPWTHSLPQRGWERIMCVQTCSNI